MDSLRRTWRFVESVLARSGYEVRWRPPSAHVPRAQLNGFFQLCGAHLTLEKGQVFFIQVGANDGRGGDPVFPFVRDHGWSGIAVEPLPDVYARLVENYLSFPSVRCLNAAIGPQDGTAILYSVVLDERARAQISVPGHQLSSFKKQVILSHRNVIPDIERFIHEVSVPTMTWASIMQRVTGGVDVIVVDTEGCDAEIVLALNLERIEPRIIHYEHIHLSKRDADACAAFLIRNGYQLAFNDTDVTAYRAALT